MSKQIKKHCDKPETPQVGFGVTKTYENVSKIENIKYCTIFVLNRAPYKRISTPFQRTRRNLKTQLFNLQLPNSFVMSTPVRIQPNIPIFMNNKIK